MIKHWSMKTALEQIKSCEFECEAGPLEMNTAYQWLEGAAKIGPEFWPGQGVFFQVEAKAGGNTLRGWKHYYVVGCHMDSGTDDRHWTYDLSNDPPAPYHYGTIQFSRVKAEKLKLSAES